jgi:Holliday junction DNA helicase RuvA
VVRQAVATSDLGTLTQVPGIGKKGAERLVIELRDRIGSVDEVAVASGGTVTVASAWRDQLRHALAGLGFSGKEAADAIDGLDVPADEPADVSVLLRQAIQVLGRAR